MLAYFLATLLALPMPYHCQSLSGDWRLDMEKDKGKDNIVGDIETSVVIIFILHSIDDKLHSSYRQY